MSSEGRLFVISGSSGSGKGTVLKELLKMSDKFCYSVSATTREPREGEKNGVNYFFVSREQFEAYIKSGDMLEYAEYCGNLYGTPKTFVIDMQKKGKNVLLEIEVCGAMQIKSKIPGAIMIFITPPTYNELKTRLYERGTENSDIIEARLREAVNEIKAAKEYDYIILNKKGKAKVAAENIISILHGSFDNYMDKTKIINNFLNNV